MRRQVSYRSFCFFCRSARVFSQRHDTVTLVTEIPDGGRCSSTMTCCLFQKHSMMYCCSQALRKLGSLRRISFSGTIGHGRHCDDHPTTCGKLKYCLAYSLVTSVIQEALGRFLVLGIFACLCKFFDLVTDLVYTRMLQLVIVTLRMTTSRLPP